MFYRLYLRFADVLWDGFDGRRSKLKLEARIFDPDWYIEQNPDLKGMKEAPAEHFFRHGIYEARKARFFDARWYFEAHHDLWMSRVDAWTHFRTYGRAEGRVARYFYVHSEIERFRLPSYEEWYRLHDTPCSEDKAILDRILTLQPLQASFSILLPVKDSTLPEVLLGWANSLRDQIYSKWQCCVACSPTAPDALRSAIDELIQDPRFIRVDAVPDVSVGEFYDRLAEVASNKFIVMAVPNTQLAPAALFWLADALEEKTVSVIYADEDVIDANGFRSDPSFKPDFNYELLLTHNYIGRNLVIERNIFKELQGLDQTGKVEPFHDFIFRIYERMGAGAFKHIPRVLFHRGSCDDDVADTGEAVKAHFSRIRNAAQVLPHPEMRNRFRVRYRLPSPPPLVSIIIPTRDRVELLRQCLESLFARTSYHFYEIIIIDNGSVDPATSEYLSSLNPERVRVLRDDSPFNFAALNNAAAIAARGEFLCLMNNDIEIITPDWLEEMMAFAVQPQIGCVGARLWYPNDRLQHAGVMVGFHGVAGHLHKWLKRGEHGYGGRASLHQNLSAVTAAVLVVRKAIYDAVGGMDESLAVAFNDVDLCLKVRNAGYRNVYTPHAEMYHHESASRGQDVTAAQKAREFKEINIIKERYGDTLLQDPSFNSNLSLTSETVTWSFPPRTATARERLSELTGENVVAKEPRRIGALRRLLRGLLRSG